MTLYEKMADRVDEFNPKQIKDLLLAINIDAAESMEECPWCDVPIGATTYHFLSQCPFRQMSDLVNRISR